MWFISWNNYCITKGPLHWIYMLQPVQTLHKEWYVTCRVGQCEDNGFSCDVDSDIFQRFIYYKGKGLLLPRAPCSLKNCHLMESGEKEEQQGWFTSLLFKLVQWRKTLHLPQIVQTVPTALSYQSWSGCVKDDICGLRQLFLGHLDGLASRGQSQVLVVIEASSSEGTTTPRTTARHEKWHLRRSFNVEINP